MNSNDVIALSDLRTGEHGVVLRLEGGRGFLGRMAALGFNPGATVEVVRNDGFGPLIVNILDTQIALGRGQASKIYMRRKGR